MGSCSLLQGIFPTQILNPGLPHFKWIAKVIRDNEGIAQYIGGGEESFGFLAEDFCRDKDSVGQNTGVGSCSLLQGIFLTQR